MNSLVSVIIPIYNSQIYLNRCLDSVVNQTYSNLQIIIIDDGSDDNSLDICLTYKNNDKRVEIIHQENQGQSVARNKGLDVCKGDYIIFVDSDDWLELNMIDFMLRTIKKENSDIVMCNVEQTSFNDFYKKDNFMSSVLKDEIGSQLWKFMFKSYLWENIRLPIGRYAEDAMVMYKIIDKANVFSFIFETLYNYYENNPESSSNQKKMLLKNTVDRAIMFIERLEWIREKNYYSKDVENNILKKATEFSIGAMGCYKKYEYKQQDINILINFFKDYLYLIIHNPLLSIPRKIAVIIINISPNAYYYLKNIIMR